MIPSSPLNRRRFIQSSTAVVAATALSTNLVSQQSAKSNQASTQNKIRLGVIGFGPRCDYVMKPILAFPDVQCVAVADVQEIRRQSGKRVVDEAYGNQNCAVYSDFRELLDRQDIDAVIVATGDRWHARASIMAAQSGKDVYSEKPCGITIQACQELAQMMHTEKRVFQAGTQRRSVPNFRAAIEMVHAGTIGKLKTLHASVYYPELQNNWLPGEKTPDPQVEDWNLWLGPSPWRPYHPQYVNGGWRGQWDFESGARLLDWGAHTVDLCQWANQADETLPVEYIPHADKIICQYENGVEMVLDFLKEPFGERAPHYITRLGTCPVRFVGELGSIETGDTGEIVISPESLTQDQTDPHQRVVGLDVQAHARNFFDCIRSREMPISNQDVMKRSHIACHAAAISWVLQRPLKFNPALEEFIDDPEANRLKSRPERQWST